MIILFLQVLIANWKRTTKLLSALSLEAVHDETLVLSGYARLMRL